MKARATIWLSLIFLPLFCFAETDAQTTVKADAKPAATTTVPAAINCQYKLAKDTETVAQTVLSKWAENAAVQSFQFNAANIKNELGALKNCYTEQGWKGFNDALKASGNLDAIEKNQLTVTSQISGTTTIQNIKEKQWKASVPLKVTYQNKDKQLLQTLDVSLLIALNQSGSLGIMQVIAVPKDGDKQN
jgi:hypothetical protein